MRYHYTPIRMAKMKKCRQQGVLARSGATGALTHRWGNVKWYGHWRKLLVISDKVKYTLTVSTSNPLVAIYSKERKTYVHTKTCRWGLIAALFIIAQNWKSPQLPSTGEWIGRNTTPLRRRRNYWFMQQPDWISKTPHWVKEAELRRSLLNDSVHTTVPEKQTSSNGERVSGCQGLWVRGGHDCKYQEGV